MSRREVNIFLGSLAAALLVAVVVTGRLIPDLDPAPTVATISVPTLPTLPDACAEALTLGKLLAGHVVPLTRAVSDHREIMRRLDLGLEHKSGGITGAQAYQLGERQMPVFETHGPSAEAQADRYQEVVKRCPLQ